MRTYECCPAFGWGVAGPATSGIRRKLRELGLDNLAPVSYAKLSELIVPFAVKVAGEDNAVDELENYMQRMGYDGR